MGLTRRRLAIPIACVVFSVFIFRPLYISALRGELQRNLPETWEATATNGSFSTLVPQLLGNRYSDEALYAARVKQILIHGVPYNPYWREDRAFSSWSTDFISHYLLAGSVMAFGGNLPWGWVATAALLAALWFLLFFKVFRWWSGKDEVAVPLALFSVFFPDFYLWLLDINFNWKVDLERYASVFFQHHSQILPAFHRLPTLFLTLLLLSLLFLGTWRLALEERFRPLPAMLLGVGYALMRYAHPFEYALGMASIMVFTAALWALKAPVDSRKNVTLAFCVALAGATLYAWLAFTGWGASGTTDFMEPMSTRHFYLITLIHVLFAALGLRQAQAETTPERRTAWILLSAVQIAALLCRNTQVVVGFAIQIMHYIPMGSFFGTLMIFLLLAGFLSRRAFWDVKMGAVTSIFLVLWAFANQKAAAEQTYLMCGLPRHLETALQWVDKNLPTDTLILSLSAETNMTVPLYTRAKVQIPVIGINFSGVFTREAFLARVAALLKTCHADTDRFIAERWIYGPAKENARGQMSLNLNYLQKADTQNLEAAIWFYTFFPDYDPKFDQSRNVEQQNKLRALTRAAEPLQGPFYLWVNEADRRFFIDSPESFAGKLVYQNPKVAIFEFPAALKS